MSAITLLPAAALLTGTLRLGTGSSDAVVDWATALVFNPLLWFGVGLAGLSVVLFGVSGAMAAAARRSRTRRPTRRRSARKKRDALPAVEGPRRARPSTTTWPTSRRSSRSAASREPQTTSSRATGSARGSTPPSPALPTPPATPTMVVDLDAFDANAADLARRAGGTPLRVATKSLRVPALVARALAADGFSGAMGYSLREALWLHEQGICSDIV